MNREQMKTRVARAAKVARKTLRLPRVRYNTAGHGFSFADRDPCAAAAILNNTLPSHCQSRVSNGRVFVSVYPW